VTRLPLGAASSLLVALVCGACVDVRLVGERFADDTLQVIDGDDASVLGSALDDAGNLYLVGTMSGQLAFPGGTLSAPGPGAAFVVSLTSEGTHRWSHAWVSSTFVSASDVVVEGGRVRVAGYVSGVVAEPISFDGGARQTAVIFDFNVESGDPIAVSSAYTSASGNVQVKAITGDESEHALVGHFVGELNVGAGPLPPSPAGVDSGFVAVFDADGAPRWAAVLNGANVELARGAFVAGGVVAGGWFSRGRIYDSEPARGRDGVAVVFDGDGTVVSTLVISSEADDAVSAVAAHGDGHVVVGTYGGPLELGGVALSHAGQSDAFISVFAADGALSWARGLGSSRDDHGRRVSSLDDGSVLMAGTFSGTLNFAGETLVTRGGSDVFVAAYDGDGNELWVRSFGGDGDDRLGSFDRDGETLVLSVFVDGEVLASDGTTASGPLTIVRTAI